MTPTYHTPIPSSPAQAARAVTVNPPLEELDDKLVLQDARLDALESPSGLQKGYGGELTISAGSITPTHKVHSVDTEGDAATDDLDTIDTTNMIDGDTIILRSENTTRDTTVKHNTGNMRLVGAADYVLSNNRRTIALLWVSVYSDFIELSRSDNL